MLRRPRADDAPALHAFHVRNDAHFTSTSPRRPSQFYTAAFWAEAIARSESDFREDRRVALNVFQGSDIVAMVNLMNIVRGALRGCDLGYGVDAAHQGTGLMFWAVQRALDYAFSGLGLHRVQANHLPENQRSARLLSRLGFKREGYAERFLLIDGLWRDHVLNALLHDAWLPPAGEEFLLDDSARSPV